VKAPPAPWPARIFAATFGAFLGLALLKFADPPIMQKYVTAPQNVWEFLLFSAWPVRWAYWLLLVVAVVGVLAARWRPAAPIWLVALPFFWLIWQGAASARSLGPELSNQTLRHFACCVACFYLGLCSLRRAGEARAFWCFLFCAFLLVLASGWEQRFGGLAATRRYFYAYLYPGIHELPPEYLKRLSSNRIFATLFYPNALAGGILLLLPITLATVWEMMRKRFTVGARQFLLAVTAVGALSCLYWSGSKGGWLLMLLLGLIALLRTRLAMKIKLALVGAVLVAGLAGFVLKYAGFFERGATSVSARFDYWRAALRIAAANPVFGTGPGTFSMAYQQVKRPESESARLVHNDYLEQASDSGVLGAALYTVFIAGSLAWSFRRKWPGASPVTPAKKPVPKTEPAMNVSDDWFRFAVWLGVLGWSLQSLFEFPLYVPSLSWLAFALLGWLLGREDSPGSGAKP
jgi:O-antigen ligase